MKKLLLVLAIATFGIVLNAATVTWSMSGVTSSPENEAKAGMVAYFLLSDTFSSFTDNINKLKNKEITASAFTTYVTSNSTYNDYTISVSGHAGTSININNTSGTYNPGDTVSGYIVLFDSTNVAGSSYFAYTTVKSDTVNAVGSNLSLAYGTFATATSTTGGWTAIPEPTSGLLMLLGAAGLALKRKRV